MLHMPTCAKARCTWQVAVFCRELGSPPKGRQRGSEHGLCCNSQYLITCTDFV